MIIIIMIMIIIMILLIIIIATFFNIHRFKGTHSLIISFIFSFIQYTFVIIIYTKLKVLLSPCHFSHILSLVLS